MANTETIREMIKKHDDLYYNQDSPEISDAEYDALKRQLGEEDEAVPGEVSRLFEKYTHTHPIKSLAKINSEEELRKELKRLSPGVIQPKLDGLTLVIYPDGAVVTRGTGKVGENVSATAAEIEGLPTGGNLPYPVRIEGVIRKDTFEGLVKFRQDAGKDVFKNPRNAVAGMLRNKDVSRVQGVTYKAYNLVGCTEPELVQLEILEELGFELIESFSYTDNTIEDAVAYVKNFDREAYPYEIDGLVIKSDVENALAVHGETGHHPKSMVAWKFPSVGKWTKLIEVIWQAGRSGKVTPVALVEPTTIDGSTIGRVTLHNMNIMRALGIKEGSEVLLVKANDVIPAITEAKSSPDAPSIDIPTKCPECGSFLAKVNDQLFCENPQCYAKLLFNVCRIGGRDALDIFGLSEETVKKLIDGGFIEQPFDLFTVTKEQIASLDGFAEKSAEKLHNAIQGARKTSLDRFLYAAGLTHIGRSVSAQIMQEFGTLDAFLADIEAGAAKFVAMDGIGEAALGSVNKYIDLFYRLREYVEIELPTPSTLATSKPEKQLTFVITGTLENPRSYYELLIQQAGHKVSGSISKNTDYLLAGEKAGSKLAKAEKLGVAILTDEGSLATLLSA